MGLPVGAVRKKWYNMNHKTSKPKHTPRTSPDGEPVKPINPGSENSYNSPSYGEPGTNNTDNNTERNLTNQAESSGTCINANADVYTAVLKQLFKACDAVGLKAEKVVIASGDDRTTAEAEGAFGGVSVWSYINE